MGRRPEPESPSPFWQGSQDYRASADGQAAILHFTQDGCVGAVSRDKDDRNIRLLLADSGIRLRPAQFRQNEIKYEEQNPSEIEKVLFRRMLGKILAEADGELLDSRAHIFFQGFHDGGDGLCGCWLVMRIDLSPEC